MKAIHKKRLLKAAEIVEEVPRKEFYMGRFYRECGTPACILGHYQMATKKITRSDVEFFGDAVNKHFGVQYPEGLELFGLAGCGGARTGKQAAKYIRAFVKRKEKECSTKS